jgi:hypothetical protein
MIAHYKAPTAACVMPCSSFASSASDTYLYNAKRFEFFPRVKFGLTISQLMSLFPLKFGSDSCAGRLHGCSAIVPCST